MVQRGGHMQRRRLHDRAPSLLVRSAPRVGLIAASLAVLDQRDTKLGLDLQGGVQLVYEAEPTAQQPTVTPEALQRALDIMRERVDALGVSEPELLQSGRNQIEVSLPGVENAERAADQVGTTAQLYFYDWEPTSSTRTARPTPEQVNGGQQRDHAASTTRSSGASKCPTPQLDDNIAASGRFYAFDKVSKRPLKTAQPPGRRAGGARGPRRRRSASAPRCSRCPRASSWCATRSAARRTAAAASPDSWWVMQGPPGALGHRHQESRAELRAERRRPADRHVRLHGQGPQGVPDDTRADRPARRRQRRVTGVLGRPGLPPLRDPARRRARLDAVHQLPRVPRRHRRLAGASISGGFTIQTAQDLARLLKIGALPLRLDLISRSQVSATLGRQALDQGLIAGLAGFAIVALFLLVFYRVLGVIAVLALGSTRCTSSR